MTSTDCGPPSVWRRVRSRVPVLLIAAPAAVSIWAGWVQLGEMCGYGPVHPLPGIAEGFTINTAITLPVGMEAYAAYALGAWLTTKPLRPVARAFAKRSALAALGLGLLGQAVYHLLAAWGQQKAPWPVVLFLSTLPVLVLGAAAALYHLLNGDTGDQTAADPVPAGAEPAALPAAEPPALDPSAVSAPVRPASATRRRTRPATTSTRSGKTTGRKLLPAYLAEARVLLAAEPAGTDPSPSWCQRVTGCSDGTSVKLSRALRQEHPTTTDDQRIEQEIAA